MTREEAKKKLEEVLNFAKVVEAYSEGKTVQHMSKGIDAKWEDCHYTVEFDDLMKYYRIKPEPREFWINIYRNWTSAFPTKKDADEQQSSDKSRLECIHVREVL